MSGKIKFQNEKLEQVVNLYKNGMTLKELATKFNCGKDAIRSAMNRAGVETRTGYERTYNVNDNYFETIDTEDKAYWLGFIVTDGCVANNNTKDKKEINCLIIHLKGSDIKHLEKFKNNINFDGPVKINNSNGGSVYLTISSKKMCDDLAKYGVVRNKTGKCYKSNLIPEHLEKHFWRGCIDGDGTISQSKLNNLTIGLVGNKDLVFDFVNYANKCGVVINPYKDNRNWSFEFFNGYCHGEKAFKLSKILYENASVYLDRKFECYELFTNKFDWLL